MATIKQRLRNEREREQAVTACGGRPVLQVGRRFRVVSIYGWEDSRATFSEASVRATGVAATYRLEGDRPAAESVKVVDTQPWRDAKGITAGGSGGGLRYTRMEGERGMGGMGGGR